ncbi:hypothetical protein NDU88_001812 [Pleurodeles waltl]|uniref:Uncharacterized protein n=1 Tax=Pleurodeles waltl TaxID=8319 RepID=A0AAV7VXU4_PLEWA|nr:hypothetical protein NDU88_001812 [Pleurodeles waltl]
MEEKFLNPLTSAPSGSRIPSKPRTPKCRPQQRRPRKMPGPQERYCLRDEQEATTCLDRPSVLQAGFALIISLVVCLHETLAFAGII